IGLHETNPTNVHHYGTVAGTWNRNTDHNREQKSSLFKRLHITEIVEKPSLEYAKKHLKVDNVSNDNFLTAFGLYILDGGRLLEIIGDDIECNRRKNGRFQLTTALETLRIEQDLQGYMIDGVRFDIGASPQSYVQTLSDFKHQINQYFFSFNKIKNVTILKEILSRILKILTKFHKTFYSNHGTTSWRYVTASQIISYVKEKKVVLCEPQTGEKGTDSKTDEEHYVVDVSIVKASNLKNVDVTPGDKSDPYCICTINDMSHQTKTIENNLNPTWNEHCTFLTRTQPTNIKFEIWDSDGALKDDSLGEVVLPLTGFFEPNHSGYVYQKKKMIKKKEKKKKLNLSALEKEVKNLQKILEEATASELKLKSQLRGQEEKVQALEQVAAELEKSLKATKDQSDTAKSNLEQEKSHMQQEYKKLADEKQQLEAKNQALESKYQALESKYQGLESKYQGLESKYQGLESKNQGLESEYQELESKYQGLKSKVQELETKNQALETKCQELEARNRELEEKSERLRTENQELTSRAQTLKATINELETVVEKMMVKYRQTSEELQVKNEENSSLLSLNNQKTQELEGLLAQQHMSEAQNNELAERCNQLERQNEELCKEIELLQYRLQDLEEHAKALQDGTSHNNNHGDDETMRSLQHMIDDLTASSQRLEQEKSQLQNQMNTLTQQLECMCMYVYVKKGF
ncbi:RNA polymerase Rpb1 repeat domain-containing protein, partial [Reticulomyxa filosa]